jgi:hypothetical protein
MTLISLKEIHDGRSGDDQLDKKSSKRSYTRRWRAVTSSVYDGPDVVLKGLPALGSLHPKDSRAYARNRNADNDPKSKTLWHASVKYSTETPANEDPNNDPPQYSWDTVEYQRPYMFDKDGKGLLNSVGDFFENGTEDADAYWVCTIKRSLPFVPTWITTYRNVVNSEAFVLDGISVPERCGWLRMIKIEPVQNRNDLQFRPVTFQIACKCNEQIRAAVAGVTIKDNWEKYILDQGLRAKVADPGDPNYGKPVPACNADGTFAQRPFCLDGAGNKLDPVTPATAVFLAFRLKREKPFLALPLW